MNIIIIGSFRKYYNEICALIDYFENIGINVLSPIRSLIVNELNGFVLLQSDNKYVKPYQIQQRVFENADEADFVYVWNPDGYIGLSTAYEIGCITEKGKTIYFKERVSDLPLYLPEYNIKSPEQIKELYMAKKMLISM